ncbi:MAG TPA: alanine racemase [Aestuariivirgaceae bacterium]|nr:alanine racemase [Aestuariivirgaceae bacterium]
MLTVDLGNLQRNWLALAARAAPAECAGVIKADAYGLGLRPCARALWAAGCRSYFVAVPQEGAELRSELPDATIFVLDGLLPGLAPFYAEHGLIPCLGSFEEIAEWAGLARARGHDLKAALHVETGINRLGLCHGEARGLHAWPDLLDGLDVVLIMSHFACADDPDSEMNRRQRHVFDRTRELLRPAPASLFNSPATLRDSGSPYDIVRTGVALYGGNPFDDREEPMAPVAHVSAILLQVREIAPGETVGYGATWRAARRSRIGVLGVGYADGFRRAMVQPLSKSPAHVYIDGHFAPIVGRISMDLITIDLTDVPPETARRGARVELLGEHVTINDVARWAGTIPYEILTGLGSRLARQYTSYQA